MRNKKPIKILFVTKLIVVLFFLLSYCNPFDNESASCGGSFTETDSTASAYYDYNVTLSPGCTISISGVGSAGLVDNYLINTGTATSVTLTATWATGADSANLSIIDFGFINLATYATATADNETGTWTATGTYIPVYVAISTTALVNYTLVIQGN